MHVDIEYSKKHSTLNIQIPTLASFKIFLPLHFYLAIFIA